jgi:DNA invertase Pin-like site-specific DNA recombinase
MHSTNTALIPAAQYVRTSARFQEAYLERQKRVIAGFAKANGFAIATTYSDEARSGLVLNERSGMQQLLHDVLQKEANYRAILVQDVSRWGRFQDPDEAAHYEFLCKSAGVQVMYCNEPYINSRTFAGKLFKNMRRGQAGEFSRELGEKVVRSARRIAGLGFRLGGTAGYGFRRMMVSEDGKQLRILRVGEFKHSKTNRTILVPGPAQEVAIVREMFSMAANQNVGCRNIVADLNRRGVLFHMGKPWDYGGVLRTLTNPKYTGTNVWGRSSVRLKTPKRLVKLEDCAVKENAFAPIVSNAVFDRVQTNIRSREAQPWTDEELLTRLRRLVARTGKLSQRLIDKERGLPSSATYYAHFGPLRKLYPLIGYRAERGSFTKIFGREQNEKLRAQLLETILKLFPADLSVFHLPNRRRLILRLDNGLSISVLLCRSVRLRMGEMGWKIYPTPTERDYITLVCRLKERNDSILDFHLFPYIVKRSWYKFSDKNIWFRTGRKLRQLEDLCREAKSLSRLDDASSNVMPC